MTLEQLKREVEALSDSDRGELLTALIDSMPEPSYTVTDDEVARRRAELESGEVSEISFDELRAALDLPR
jgi:hypothetical protein